MDLTPDDFECELIRAASQLLDRRCAISDIRDAHGLENGLVPGLWDAAVDQGWFLLAVPEEEGGIGGRLYHAAMIMEEVGRYLAPGPWIGTFVAAFLLGDTKQARRAREGARVALGLDVRGSGEPPRLNDGQLVGRCPAVQFALDAEAVLVDIHGELWWVEAFQIEALEALDPGLRLADVILDKAQACRLGISTADILPLLDVLAAAQSVGVATGAFTVARDYALTREQFGQPIGAFQVIKHRLADAAARVEQARALATMSAVRISEGSADVNSGLSAWYLACQNARQNANDAVIIHGAMGFTWECDAHLFLKRALSLGEFRMSMSDALDLAGAALVDRTA